MKRTKQIIALFLAVGLCIGICGCTMLSSEEQQPVIQQVEEPKMASVQQEAVIQAEPNLNELSKKSAMPSNIVFSEENSLSVSIDEIPESLCPLLAESESEVLLSSLTTPNLIMLDRNGNMLSSGTTGEVTAYSGTDFIYYSIADYHIEGNSVLIELDDDIYFSDGVNMTADDIIFTLYVMSDPSYEGRYSLADVPVCGMEEYRGNLCPKWKVILQSLSEQGRNAKSDFFSDADKDLFLTIFDRAGLTFTKNIISAAVSNFGSEYSRFVLGCSEEELLDNPGYQVAFAEYFWDYAIGLNAENGKWVDSEGKQWNLKDAPPTEESFWKMICSRHSYNISNEGINHEMAGEVSFSELLFRELEAYGPELYRAVGTAESEHISGIEKVDMYSVRVSFTESANKWLSALAFPVCPLHALGDRNYYCYTENRFGFTKGDLSFLNDSTACSVSAGAFYPEGTDENGVILAANSNFYRGAPLLSGIVLTIEKNANISTELLEEQSKQFDICTDYSVCIGIKANIGMDEERAEPGDTIFLRNAIRSVLEGYAEAECNENGEWVLSEKNYSIAMRAIEEVTDKYEAEGIEIPEFTFRLYGEDKEEKIIDAAAAFLNANGFSIHVEEQTSPESLANYIKEGMADVFSFVVYRLDDIGLKQFTSDNEDNMLGYTDDAFDNAVLNENWAEAGELLDGASVLIELWKKTNSIYIDTSVSDESLPQNMTEYYSWFSEPEKLSK